MSQKYLILKELISEWIEREMENYEEAVRLVGTECPGACLAAGALDAYQQVLRDIEELEREASV